MDENECTFGEENVHFSAGQSSWPRQLNGEMKNDIAVVRPLSQLGSLRPADKIFKIEQMNRVVLGEHIELWFAGTLYQNPDEVVMDKPLNAGETVVIRWAGWVSPVATQSSPR